MVRYGSGSGAGGRGTAPFRGRGAPVWVDRMTDYQSLIDRMNRSYSERLNAKLEAMHFLVDGVKGSLPS